MKYFIYAPLQILCMMFCYLTNWLVVLPGTEEGQLPGFLNLWNTWDDTLDNKTDMCQNRCPMAMRKVDCYEQCSFMKEYWAVTKQVADEYGLFVIPKEIKW